MIEQNSKKLSHSAVVLARKSARGERRTLTLGYTGCKKSWTVRIFTTSQEINKGTSK